MPPQVRLEFKDVRYGRDGSRIIDGISLCISEHRTGLVGLNGSGKTTFARLACGLVKPDAGQVLLNGTNVALERKDAIRLVGIVFQNPDHQIIFPTVEEEIAFGPAQIGLQKQEARNRAHEILDEFGRGGWAERPVHTLSQGQRHLVCIMSVMAMRPSMLVLDEPFSGPDRPTVLQLHRAMEDLDVAQLLITHDLQYLAGFDRVIWIDRGRIRQDGSPETVLRAFSSEIDRLSELDALSDFPDQDSLSPIAGDG